MEKIDYYSQSQQIGDLLNDRGDLLNDRGVQLTKSDRVELLNEIRNYLIQGDCALREFNLGDWILILQGADEYVLLLENMQKLTERR